MTPCYPLRMEIFLVIILIAMLAVFIVDTGQKRRAYLCQQVKVPARSVHTRK